MFLTINNPLTKQYTNLFSDDVNHLINNGYTIQDVFNLSKIIPHYYTRDNIFGDDLLINYMIHLELTDIISLSLIDKRATMLINNNHLWYMKINNLCGHVFKTQYNLLNYKKSVYAHKKMIDFMRYDHAKIITFKPEDDLSKLSDSKNYTKNTYTKQALIIDNKTIQIKVSIGDKALNTKKVAFPINEIKKVVFNIYFYFPDVN